MTRKITLEQTVNQYLDYDNQGAYKQRQLRRFVLNKIIADFYCLRKVPPSWYALKASHVEQLVQFWKKNDLHHATIMNYLVCLRSFLKKIDHYVEGIDNASLNLVKSRINIKPRINRDEVLSRLQDPIAIVLFTLQSFFGLTLSEAMKFIPTIHVLNNELCLTREIASNSRDRYIPILCKRQEELIASIKQFLFPELSLISQFGEPHVRLCYRYGLKVIGLSTNVHYRYLYAKTRMIALQNLPKREQHNTIKREMSITAASTVWGYCHE